MPGIAQLLVVVLARDLRQEATQLHNDNKRNSHEAHNQGAAQAKCLHIERVPIMGPN